MADPATSPRSPALMIRLKRWVDFFGRFVHPLQSMRRSTPTAAWHLPSARTALTIGSVVDSKAKSMSTVFGRVWDSARAACPWQGPPMWLHGDLHPANILVADGKVSAVIDFGDVCAGDPATDLGAAWMLLPERAMPRFDAAYGGLDSDLERRALGWAVLFALMLLEIGLDSRPSYEAVGRWTLARSVEHCDRTP